ncbi:uncharacterized protein GIQ15_04726 [Arthroderma uncinatum]|uniref:uncharacterized protein n=1 Tax=Arthroderma uncinatum TaxID=74035 RepID=UPI00144AA871|nr:uncharacterized protein GIQ15_04726 [Arthroderma uncinatum]KAF3481967.1 hypothetical protein GIQ15_04726 [Arthroderma uncinatum]
MGKAKNILLAPPLLCGDMIPLPFVALVLVVVVGDLIWRLRSRVEKANRRGILEIIRDLRTLAPRHETASALLKLIDEDGAGAWPPNAEHNAWPAAFRPYKDIYLELLPLFTTAEPVLHDNISNERRNHYRSLMRKLLVERINIVEVEKALAKVERGVWNGFPRDAYNGIYCCIATSRHAYRWALNPIVKVAQLETIVEFPPELVIPWSYFQRKFGVTSECGNGTANVLHNFSQKGEIIYKINVGVPDLITSSEEAFFRIFRQIETLALSIMICYIQGFHGWGIGKMVNGKFVKYNGLSGSHMLFFFAVDAFLGLELYLSDEERMRNIPATQRKLASLFKKYSFRHRLREDEDMKDEVMRMVNQMQLRGRGISVMATKVPPVTCDDLATFHAKHFATHNFKSAIASNIITPACNAIETAATGYENSFDDGLGYYPDGVKRTLTDQQIQIFRHSEIQALLRQKELEEQSFGNDEQTKDGSVKYEARGQIDVAASTSYTASNNKKGVCKEHGQSKRTKLIDDINGQINETPNNFKRPVQNDLNQIGTFQPEGKKTAKAPAEFQRRLVSYGDA